jgi:hypothetical protein
MLRSRSAGASPSCFSSSLYFKLNDRLSRTISLLLLPPLRLPGVQTVERLVVSRILFVNLPRGLELLEYAYPYEPFRCCLRGFCIP